MLRITRTETDLRAPVIKLEGKLLEPWVEEVARLFCATEDGPLPRLDLADLTFVDSAGSRLLQDLLSRGVRIEACATYVAELLHWVPNPDQ